MKNCSGCKQTKSVSLFNKNKAMKDGYSNQCKDCLKLGYEKYKEKRLDAKAEYYRENKEKKLEWQKEYTKENKEKIREYNKEYRKSDSYKESRRSYYKENRETIIKRNCNYIKNNKDKVNKRQRERRKNDPLFKLSSNVRRRINHVLSNKSKRSFEIIGCSVEELKKHLESQFEDGMTWDNYEYYGWHVDHIIPLARANTEEEIYNLCHYTNLQPMWMEENFRKGKKI